MDKTEKEKLKILLLTGKITTLAYINKLGEIEYPFPRATEEEKRTGNTPRVRAYCRRHGL